MPDFVKPLNRVIRCLKDNIILNSDRRIGSSAAEMPVKFLNDQKTLILHLVSLRFCNI